MDINVDQTFEPLPEMEIRLFPMFDGAQAEPSLWRMFMNRKTGQKGWLHIPAASARHMSSSLVYQDEG